MVHRLSPEFCRCLSILVMGICATFFSGCQQTTGIAPGSTLTPVSPLAPNGLSPVQPTSAIGPFGGNTRVPPPATNSYSPRGSYTVPNNYMGGSSPLSQNNLGTSPSVPNAGGWRGNQVAPVSGIGPASSNVQPAGGGSGSGFQSPGNSVPSTVPNMNGRTQSGGMPVIDLTGAPPPPGYRSSPTNPFLSSANNESIINAPNNSVVPRSYIPNIPGAIQSVPQMLPPIQNNVAGSSVTLPNPQFQASASNSIGAPANDWSGNNPRAGVPLPSTSPVQNNQRNNLSWRSPAPRY